jgi:membrane associated rhomboid family serine protease
MFPIGDDNSDRTTVPVTNYVLIGINILVFVFLQQLGTNDHFTYAFSLVPKEITTGADLSGVYTVVDSVGNRGQIELYSSPLPDLFQFP